MQRNFMDERDREFVFTNNGGGKVALNKIGFI